MLSNAEAAELALLVVAAMDSHLAAPLSLSPPPDPRLSPNWQVVGYLTATDAIWRKAEKLLPGLPTCYGFLAQSVIDPKSFLAVIRGTQGIIEWAEDACVESIPHPAGKVEAGFWDIYASLLYTPEGSSRPMVAARGISDAVGTGTLTVVGHSLGGALATYLTYDLAAPELLGRAVSGCYFASPKPGNAAFGAAFAARVSAYQLFAYVLDAVPHSPIGPDYEHLPGVTWIWPHTSQAKIKFGLSCFHHALSYAAQLDYTVDDWSKVCSIDAAYAACIKGPAISSASTDRR